MKKVKGYVRGTILTAITIMAGFLIFCAVGIIELPEWDVSWIPVQVCMFCVGMGWMILFCAANGAFDECEE